MQIWEQIQNMAWDVCFVIVLVLLLRPLVGRVSRSLCYGMWILVAVRLMCPVLLSSPVSMFNWVASYDVVKSQVQGYVSGEAAADTTAGAEGRVASGSTLTEDNTPISDSIWTEGDTSALDSAWASGDISTVGNASVLSDPAVSDNQPTSGGAWNAGNILALGGNAVIEGNPAISRITCIVWIAGMGIMLLYGMGSYLRMKHRLRFATRLQGNIYENEVFDSPFVFGAIRPRIYLPYGLEGRQQDYIIRHEAFHIKRRDHLVKILAFGLLSVYWFHPLVWVSYYMMTRDMEMSCDAHVLRSMDGEGKRFYSSLLLRFATDRKLRLPEPLSFGEQSAVSRVKHILKHKKPKLWMVTAALILLAGVVIFSLTDRNGTNDKNWLAQSGTAEVRGMSQEEFAEKLWESRNPYIGDASKNGALLGLLLDYYDVQQGATTELQTSVEPYGITLHFSGEPEEASMQNTAAIFLALTENCGEFRWDYTDNLGELVSCRLRTEDANERYQVEQIKSYAKSSDTVAELLGLLQENDGNREDGMKAAEEQQAEKLDESRVIAEQSFDVALNQWGETRFVSYAPSGDENFEDVSFLLEKEGEVVYRFPYYYENNNTADDIGLFDSVEAVGFRDMNQDGLQDVIVIINYVTGAGLQGMEPRSAVRIFMAEEDGFFIATDLMDDIAGNMEEKDLYIDGIYKYAMTEYLDESRVISEQSFDVDLDPWGEVQFISYAPQNRRNFQDASFLLKKAGEVVYRFPYYRENNNVSNYLGYFDSVEAVDFRDVNQDGLQDVIVIMNYVTGTVDQGKASTASAARIFVADGAGFYVDTELMDEVADHFDENELSVEAIYRYIENQRAEGILRDGTGSSEGGDKQLSRPAEGQL